jgi:hypothetical protein
MSAPVASGWSGRRVGLAPTGKAPPCHGARGMRSFRTRRLASGTHFRPCLSTYDPDLKAGQNGSGAHPSLVFAVLLLPLPFPFCNDGQAATVKLVNLLKHFVYFGLGDQPTFIGEIDHSLLVLPFGAGPEPNKARNRAQGSDRWKQCPCQRKSLHFLLPVAKLASLLT